jgi:hypothetical protein
VDTLVGVQAKAEQQVKEDRHQRKNRDCGVLSRCGCRRRVFN